MEEKQKFPTATGFSGKILIASLFILSGILLFARNMGWVTSEVFDMIVSWHSFLIILGIYSMIRRHFIGGIIFLLIGVYFLIGGLSWLPENSQAMVWPIALITAGVLFFLKSGKNRRGHWAHHHAMQHRQKWMKMHQGQSGMNFESEMVFYVLRMFGELPVTWYLTNCLKELSFAHPLEEQRLICGILILHPEKHT